MCALYIVCVCVIVWKGLDVMHIKEGTEYQLRACQTQIGQQGLSESIIRQAVDCVQDKFGF